MGKRRNTETLKRAGILILGLLLGCQCILVKEKKLIYYGRFKLYLPEKVETGKWQATEQNGKIDKLYILSNLGFPVATITLNAGKIMVNGKELEANFKNLISKAAIILPEMARGKLNYANLQNVKAYAFERGKVIFIVGKNYMLEIKITALRNIP